MESANDISAPSDCVHFVCSVNDNILEKQLDPVTYGTKEDPYYGGVPAQTFAFTLDKFQKLAIACVERKESVLVAAHTSAGKTVVAEYACAVGLREHQKVVYTSPIKALSNQKYRELEEKFKEHGEGSVGLMTGDVTLNPNANIIVMTTEILRSMLYRASEMLREIAWVIFDEVHYMQDKERGVVWEETIIILPHEIRMIFLSATLPNAKEFAEWIAHIHRQPCHVVYTEVRPIPLKHYGYAQGSEVMTTLVDVNGLFKPSAFEQLMSACKQSNDRSKKSRKIETNDQGKWKKAEVPLADNCFEDLQKLVQVFRLKDFLPAIVFSFSKRSAEANAVSIATAMDLTNSEEKEQIEFIVERAIAGLSEIDQNLPAIQHLKPILKRGVAVHHSGMLPIMKEVTEILFQESCIKVLCATETFAMGLNMPARTVLFTSLRKYDGVTLRTLSSGEYIQMSGRAGRRGKDRKGIVVMMLDSQATQEECQNILMGSASPLESSFRLSYYTLLNLLQKVEGTQQSIHDIIKKSFQQFQHDKNVPNLQEKVKKLQDQASALIVDQALVRKARRMEILEEEIENLTKDLNQRKLHHEKSLVYWTPGRLVTVRHWGIGVVIAPLAPAFDDPYFLDIALACRGLSDEATEPVDLHEEKNSSGISLGIFPVALHQVEDISRITIYIPDDLRPKQALDDLLSRLKEVIVKFKGDLPSVRWISELETDDPAILEKMEQVEKLENEIVELRPQTLGTDKNLRSKMKKKILILTEIDKIKTEMENSLFIAFQEEYRARVSILTKLGHLNEQGVLTLKGKAACCIDAGDELVCSELLFNGTLKKLNKHDLVAFLSCLVPFQEKSEEVCGEHPKLNEPIRKLKEVAQMIANASIECKVELDSTRYVESFHPWFLDIFYAWSTGSNFQDVCLMTDIFEGVIIRAARRLGELIQQLVEAARVLGDMELAQNLEDANQTLKRDIMFAASLYFETCIT